LSYRDKRTLNAPENPGPLPDISGLRMPAAPFQKKRDDILISPIKQKSGTAHSLIKNVFRKIYQFYIEKAN